MKKGLIYALITAVLFVTLEPVSKLIANEVSPYGVIFWRFFIGSVVLLPSAVIRVKQDKINVTLKDFFCMLFLGILITGFSIVGQIAVKTADAPSVVAVIFSSSSVFSMLLALLFVKEEKLTPNKVIALALGALGIVACGDFRRGTNFISVVLAVLVALCFSLYTALSQKYMKKFSGTVQSSGVFLSGSIILLIVLLVTGEDVVPEISVKSVGILLYMGIFITGIGYLSYFKAMEKGGAIMASLAFFIKPILIPAATFLINGIIPDIRILIAIASIVAASYFAAYGKPKEQ